MGMIGSVDIPILCKNCLGVNKHLVFSRKNRMTHCSITHKEFYPVEWITLKGQKKSTLISKEIAFLKQVCQGCLKSLNSNKIFDKTTIDKFTFSIKKSRDLKIETYCTLCSNNIS